MCMDHKDLAYELKNPLAKTLDPERSHSYLTRLVSRRSHHPYANASGQFVLSGMASAASTRNSGDRNYPPPGRPFYTRVIPSAKYLTVLRVSLKTDEFASFL